jgi:Ca2+-transporting ATPase
MTTPHWTLGTQELEAALRTDAGAGLTSSEAHERRRQHGPNLLQQQQGQTAWGLLLDQFRDFMIWVLIGAAVVSGVMREWVDAVAIVLIVVLNAVLGFIQEYRAERSLAALRKLASPTSKVVRDGQVAVLRSADLVPGDLIEIEAGDHVPADARVVQHTAGFRVQEASLTGESEPVAKGSQPLESAEVPLAERTNMLFMGTSVVSGRGRALVVSTGMETELGRIAGMIQSVRSEETPLQRKLAEFGRLTVKVCFVLVAVVFALQWLRGGKTMEVFLSAVSLAVAAIPEGLPAVVTIALALGVQRMVRRNALIRRLPSVETLGCATVICSDKTGTLTRNEMTVQAGPTA